MYNPITFVKDIIDLLKEPSGNAVAAMEITPENEHILRENLDPRAMKYVKYGDFYLEFENSSTICPQKEFFKHYRFLVPQKPMELTPVETIKPL